MGYYDATHSVAGVQLSQYDLTRVGQMLHHERTLGTVAAAKLHNGAWGKYPWGRRKDGEDRGNVNLPMIRGGPVDIDWCNVLVAVGADYGPHPGLAYHVGKPAWSVGDGIQRLSWRSVTDHLSAFRGQPELNAVSLAEQLLGRGVLRSETPATFRDMLHPDLVALAERAYAESRGPEPAQEGVSQGESGGSEPPTHAPDAGAPGPTDASPAGGVGHSAAVDEPPDALAPGAADGADQEHLIPLPLEPPVYETPDEPRGGLDGYTQGQEQSPWPPPLPDTTPISKSPADVGEDGGPEGTASEGSSGPDEGDGRPDAGTGEGTEPGDQGLADLAGDDGQDQGPDDGADDPQAADGADDAGDGTGGAEHGFADDLQPVEPVHADLGGTSGVEQCVDPPPLPDYPVCVQPDEPADGLAPGPDADGTAPAGEERPDGEVAGGEPAGALYYGWESDEPQECVAPPGESAGADGSEGAATEEWRAPSESGASSTYDAQSDAAADAGGADGGGE